MPNDFTPTDWLTAREVIGRQPEVKVRGGECNGEEEVTDG
jgi:hypothetical protein